MSFIQKFRAMDDDLGCVGIYYQNKMSADCAYEETPLNSIIFASNAVDGGHYCVVQKEGSSLDESPIYFVYPNNYIIWVAKDFIDFLSLGVATESFDLIPIFYSSGFVAGSPIPTFHSYREKDFYNNIKEHQLYNIENGYDTKVKEAIKTLRNNFPLRQYPDPYTHIISTYYDINNHVDLKFGVPNVCKSKLGHYNVM